MLDDVPQPASAIASCDAAHRVALGGPSLGAGNYESCSNFGIVHVASRREELESGSEYVVVSVQLN